MSIKTTALILLLSFSTPCFASILSDCIEVAEEEGIKVSGREHSEVADELSQRLDKVIILQEELTMDGLTEDEYREKRNDYSTQKSLFIICSNEFSDPIRLEHSDWSDPKAVLEYYIKVLGREIQEFFQQD